MANKTNSTKVVTGVVRLSYANVWEPASINGSNPKYSVSLIIPKDDKETVEKIHQKLLEKPEFEKEAEAEMQLYDGFLNEKDIISCAAVRKADKYDLSGFTPDFQDPRLPGLFVNYKGRNYPETLNDAEREQYENYRMERIKRQQKDFVKELQLLSQNDGNDFVIEELQLWLENIL